MWNMFNIVFFIVKKRTVAHWINTMMHFILGFGFAVVGIYVTVVAYTAHKALAGDLYNVKGDESYTITSVSGQQVLVNASNAADCPAFSNCKAQGYWVSGVRKRSKVSVIGCSLFDIVL
jgi:hypothetical protein